MHSDTDNPSKLAFSSRCVPGSAAEQKEKERLAEFHRSKVLRKAEEELNRPQVVAQRHQEYLEACEANKERMYKNQAARASREKLLRS
jgi:hypothetical protein